jgi:outer membrane protein
MNMRTFLYSVTLNFILLTSNGVVYLNGQTPAAAGNAVTTNDSLVLSQIMQTVVQNHPSVKEAEEALNVAEARIGLAKSGYYPNVDASGSYTRLGPVSKMDLSALNIPGLGVIQLFPENSLNASINYNQVLYDFGKTRKSVGLESENKVQAGNNVNMVKQGLSLLTANTFYRMIYLQEAIRIKDQELNTLNEHLAFVEKKEQTGSATKYELLTTKVRISVTESQKLDLQTMLKIQQTILNSLMGTSSANHPKVKQEAELALPAVPEDSLLEYAYNHRLEIVISKEREQIATLQYQVVKSQNNPVLSAFASGGEKNGYTPTVNDMKLNYTAGVGIKVPIFDGNKLKNNLAQTKSGINNSALETEITRRNITNEVVENEANRVSAMQKITQNELQLAQAEEAFSLATVNFRAGAITNIDLLDAENNVSDSRLMLLKSKVDYTMSVFKLNISLGNKMY